MILRPEPVAAALDALRRPDSMVILLDPVGEVFARRAPPTWRPDRTWSSSVRATKASTSGSVRWSTSSSRSATTS